MITLYVNEKAYREKKDIEYRYEIFEYYDSALDSATTYNENLLYTIVYGIRTSHLIYNFPKWEQSIITLSKATGEIMQTFFFEDRR